MIKYVLVVIVAILSGVGVYIIFPMLASIGDFLAAHPLVFLSVIVAVAVQLIGHALRAKRTKLFIDQAASSSLRFQFGALSIGYLFNALLPFRIGELIRAYIIARRLHISFLYTFISIVIERSTDIFFLSILIAIGGLVIGSTPTWSLIVIAAVGIIVSSIILFTLVLLKNENKQLLAFINWVAHFFNDSIANRIRFKAWSLIFGLQSFFGDRRLIRNYVVYAVASWTCYIASVFIIIVSLLHLSGLLKVIVTGVSPYVISFNPLDANAYQQLVTLMPITLDASNLDVYARIIWAVLVLPMAAIGLVALLLYRPGTRQTAGQVRVDPYVNKLMRHRDISQDFPAFLETYFKGYSLSRILHKIELTGELSLVKFFKGGSDAITVLALHGDNLFVKKIVPAKHTERLRLQYKWLKKHADKKQIVDAITEHKTNDYYAIDLSYNPEHISLFEYVHTHSLDQAKEAIDDVWKYVTKNIYVLKKESVNNKERNEYVEERLMKKVQEAIAVNEDLAHVANEERIIINGETYDNFYEIIKKIKNNEQAWGDLAVYRKSTAIHGDMTVDNILIDTKNDKPFIIDPSDDNQIRGPIIDFARHTQSLIAGYEFLNNDDEPVKATQKDKLVAINYHDRRSAVYMQLNDYFQQVLIPKYLTDAEQKTILFHTGLLYARMLAHRVIINPHNALKYYAVSTVLLNQFYRQYESADA